jgi:uncharacterized cofD-like protein
MSSPVDRGYSLWRSLYVRRRWLTIGLGVKRWLLLLALGAAATGLGWAYILLALDREGWLPPGLYDLLTLQALPAPLRILLPLAVGGLIMLVAIVMLGRTLIAPLRNGESAVLDSLYQHRLRDRGPRIVAIGGGTGLPGLLRGLTAYTSNITAIVTVADDGGSSGRLRRELGLLPPGDFRNNLAALARDETLMTQVLQYRFGGTVGLNGHTGALSSAEGQGGQTLQGHAFGNLLLAALTGITGSFDEALLAAQRVLALRGRVLPSTLENVTLVADVLAPEGEVRQVVGESAIPEIGGRVERVRLEPAGARAYPPALQAIFAADLIVLGPGSLYTSILPNLLVHDLAEALVHARAPVVYICNLATQPGETDEYTVADHVDALLQHTPADFIDLVLANHNLSVSPETGGGHTRFVLPQPSPRVPMRALDLVDEARPWRHDSQKLGRAVVGLLPMARRPR